MGAGGRRILIALTLTAAAAACGGGGGGGGANRTTSRGPTAAPTLSPAAEFERDLAAVRRAGLRHTYVIARKDGAALDPNDREFIARHTPMETSQRLVTDAGRRAIIGTNFDIYPESREALEKRFTIGRDPAAAGASGPERE